MQTEENKNTKLNVDLSSIEPATRVKQLAMYGTMVDVEPNVPTRRYYRSGSEMVRMANVYLGEGSLENAYILYMKFMTLFLEKIRKHPEYSLVPAQVKADNQAKLKEVMPKAEKLKQKLLEQYAKDYKAYKDNEEKRKILAEEKKKQELEDAKLAQKLQADENKKDATTITPRLLNSGLDDVVYPEDFASPPPRAPLHHYNPAPPLIPPSAPPLSPSYGNRSAGLGGVTVRSLRHVRCPTKLLSRFLALAAGNTAKSIETCAVLAGTLERDELKITHVIVPKQTGTPDSCTTNNEEEIFHCQDQYNLITLGWIHTHPSQTAFLSSVDLHTQCSYQLMMPEAVAIVCAPKYNETGYFALTPDYGMKYISECRQSGFHPHPNEPPLFYKATHVRLDENAPIEIIDLRR